jgi:hypothetical protein
VSRNKTCECGQEIFFLKTSKGKFIPINVESLKAPEREDLLNGMERLYDSTRHITHFSTCPIAKKFRK